MEKGIKKSQDEKGYLEVDLGITYQISNRISFKITSGYNTEKHLY